MAVAVNSSKPGKQQKPKPQKETDKTKETKN